MPVRRSPGLTDPMNAAARKDMIDVDALMRINEAANQARGCAGAHQHTKVRKSVAHGASGFAMQYNTVVVFGHEPRETAQ